MYCECLNRTRIFIGDTLLLVGIIFCKQSECRYVNYPIRDFMAFTKNRTGSWVLTFLYICTCIVQPYSGIEVEEEKKRTMMRKLRQEELQENLRYMNTH